MAAFRRAPAAALVALAAGGCAGLTCGEGTQEVDGECVPADPVADGGAATLEPGHYESPLVQLQRVQGEEDHMHIYEVKYRESDQRLFFCSYTFGVIDAADPQRMEYLAQGLKHATPSGSPREPGCLHLAWDDDDPDLVYTTHSGNIDFAPLLSGWDLRSDPADPDVLDPVQLPALQEEGVSYEGIDVENGYVYVALRDHGLGIYERDEAAGFARIGTLTELSNVLDVAVRGDTAFVTDEEIGLVTVDVSDPTRPAVIGSVATGGDARDLVLVGDLAYVAAGSAGLAVVDVSDLTAPKVIGGVETPGSAVGVAVAEDRAYVAAWNDTRVYDVSDPTRPSLIGAVRNTIDLDYEGDGGDRPEATARTFAVAAHGDAVFVGNWWVPYSYQVHAERQAPFIVVPEDAQYLSFGPPLGMGESATETLEIANHGTAPLTVFDIWTDNPAFAVEPAAVRIEPGESATLTLTYTATATEQEEAILQLWSDDPQQPVRKGYLVGNVPGLAAGQAMPEARAILMDGSDWTSADTLGSVVLLAYFATF